MPDQPPRFMAAVLLNERTPMPVYLTPDQVVLMLPGLSRGQLAQLRFRGAGPNYRKPTPKTVLYVESEVIAWVETTTVVGVAGARGA